MVNIVGILTLLVFRYGGKLVHEEKISTGTLFSFLIYTIQVAMVSVYSFRSLKLFKLIGIYIYIFFKAFAFLSSLYGDFMQGNTKAVLFI